MKQLIIGVILLLTCQLGFTQIQMDMAVTPEMPSETDSVVINASVALWDGAYKFDSTIFISGNNIVITACYVYGWGSAGQVWRDTAHYKLGMLLNGEHHVTYIVRATQGLKDTFCQSYDLIDTAEVNFTIEPTGIKPEVSASSILTLYPNPATDHVVVEVNSLCHKRTKIRLSNMEGKEMMRVYDGELTVSPQRFIISTVNLPPGLYFISVQNSCESATLKLIKF